MWSSNNGLKTKVVACILSMILIKVCTQEICGGQYFHVLIKYKTIKLRYYFLKALVLIYFLSVKIVENYESVFWDRTE